MENRLVVTSLGRGEGEGDVRHIRFKRYKLLCIKQIRNKDIMYNSENDSFYLIITFNGVVQSLSRV